MELTAYYFPELTPEYLNHIKRETFVRGLDVEGTAVRGNVTGDIYAQYEQCAPHTVTTHSKVGVRQGEGRELVDYRKAVRIMRDAGYQSYIAIEFEEPEDPIVGVSRFAAYLRGCLVDA